MPILKREVDLFPSPHPARDLVFVSAGLGLDGGGRALAGRLLAGACAAFAREREIGFHILSLDGANLTENDMQDRGFGANQKALALDVWTGQWADRGTA